MEVLSLQSLNREHAASTGSSLLAAHALEERSPNYHDVKKMSRLLHRIAQDIKQSSPTTPVPSAWLINCLVNTHLCGVHAIETSWQTTLEWTLMHILQDAQKTKPHPRTFVEYDGYTPLFPNKEGFTLANTHDFIRLSLAHLRKTSSAY